MNIELRCKCGKMMQWNDGCVMGAYGPDTENCRDPFYYCECGNEVEVSERPPNSKEVEAQNSTSTNKSSISFPEYEEVETRFVDWWRKTPGTGQIMGCNLLRKFYNIIVGNDTH